MNPKKKAMDVAKGLNQAFGGTYDRKKNTRQLKKGRKYAIKHF